MNILPQRYDDFIKKDYWDKFFRKLKKTSDEFFEWYGDYEDLAQLFQKTIPAKNLRILNLGCGKSLLGEKMYDDGYENLLNIDFSESVIKEMAARSKLKRPNMTYQVMDVFKMKIDDGAFDAVVDKGTLDAVFPEDNAQNTEKVQFLFEEIVRILKPEGDYLCVSLLQEHILQNILKFFSGKKYDIEIYEVLIKNSKMYPFLVRIRKAKGDVGSITIHLRGKEPQNLTSEECIEKVKEVQVQNIFVKNAKKLSQGQRFSIDIWDQKSQLNVPKFTLHVIDSPNSKILEKKTCGCFITPQGRESSYLFSSEPGNFDLLAQTGMSRLIIALMNPGHNFTTMKDIQNDLNGAIVDLIPKDCANPSVPYMTDGDEIGDRVILLQDSDVIVEEHRMEDDMVYRSLRFSSNLNQIQSQVRLKYFDPEAKKEVNIPDADSLLPAKKGRCVGIDDSYISFENHKLMIAGFSLIVTEVAKDKPFKGLVLGAGAGVLGKFITSHFVAAKIDMVEISAKTIELAEKFFEFKQTDRLRMIQADALQFVDELAKQFAPKEAEASQSAEVKGSETEAVKDNTEEEKNTEEEEEEEVQDDRYQLVVVDINNTSKSDRFNPPREFIEPSYLRKLKAILKKDGLLIYNVISPDKSNLEQVLKCINAEFDIVYTAQPEGELNTVIYAINHTFPRKLKETKEEIMIVEEDKLVAKKTLETSFKTMVKMMQKQWDSTMNIDSYISEIALKYPNMYSSPFQKSNAHFAGKDSEGTNKTKEMYLEDLEKVNKSKRKKKKNKVR